MFAVPQSKYHVLHSAYYTFLLVQLHELNCQWNIFLSTFHYRPQLDIFFCNLASVKVMFSQHTGQQ
jgi:hypothetical protein